MKPLTAKEAAVHFEVTPRTIRNWIKAGCPHATDDSGKGRPKHFFNIKEVEEWNANRSASAEVAAAAAPNMPVHIKSAPAARPAASSGVAAMPPGSELEAMLDRLRKAERATFARWGKALKDPSTTVGQASAFRRDWQDTVDRVQKLEKEITNILKERGDFLPAAEVAAVTSRAVAVMVEKLDNLGTVIGAKIANMIDGASRQLTANDFAAEIDREAQLMKGRIQLELKAIMAAEAGPADQTEASKGGAA